MFQSVKEDATGHWPNVTLFRAARRASLTTNSPVTAEPLTAVEVNDGEPNES